MPVLARDHRCRTDDLAYPTVGAWWADHQGRVPIQAVAGLEILRSLHGVQIARALPSGHWRTLGASPEETCRASPASLGRELTAESRRL